MIHADQLIDAGRRLDDNLRVDGGRRATAARNAMLHCHVACVPRQRCEQLAIELTRLFASAARRRHPGVLEIIRKVTTRRRKRVPQQTTL